MLHKLSLVLIFRKNKKMAEKRGATGKLAYDFPTQAVLEVKLNDKWYRTTAKDFRSFDGERRYTQPKKQLGLGDSIVETAMETLTYTGPLYAYDTNQNIPKSDSQTIQSNDKWTQMKNNSEKQNKFKI